MALVFVLSLRSIKASVRVDLTLLGFEIVVFSVLAIISIVKGGSGNTLHYFTPGASSKGVSGVGLGAVFGVLSFIGFESAAVLGEESRNPRRNIPTAVIGARSSSASSTSFRCTPCRPITTSTTRRRSRRSSTTRRRFHVARRYASWMTNIIDIAGVFGLFSCFLAVQNATVRVIFSMGRDKVLPGRLGAVHKRFHSPFVAIFLTALSIAAGIGLSAWLGSADRRLRLDRLDRHRRDYPRLDMLANVGLIRFFWRDPERSILKHVVAPILGIVALAYPLWSTAKPG